MPTNAHRLRRAVRCGIVALLSLAALNVVLPHVDVCVAEKPRDAETFSHADLDTVLMRYLHEGRVDYAGLAADRVHLDRYLDQAARADTTAWSRSEQFAFWVNVYNARVLAHVIDRPGLNSVLDVGKVLWVPTLAFFRQKRLTAGVELSLSTIEHGILRDQFRDPRLHFVLNCASVSCPVLPPRALTGSTLEETLGAATRQFLGDTSRNRIEPPGTMEVSEIFKWFKDDFARESGSVRAFIETHWTGEGEFDEDIKVRHLKYDWKLNGTW